MTVQLTTPLSSDDKKQLQLAAKIALARQDFYEFARFIDPGYEEAQHLRLLSDHLNKVESGEIKRLAITLPPRHGKSEATSGKFPGWCIGRDPSRIVMVTSYSAKLAEVFSIQNRDTIASNPMYRAVFPNVHLKPNSKGREKWAVQGSRESLIAAGVGGSITGMGAWMLLIDDPIKNYGEAVSKVRKEAIYNWYTTTARTRLTPDGRVVVIMTRWVEDDLIGDILGSEEGEDFTVLHLPAISYGTLDDYKREYPSDEERVRVISSLPQTAFPDPLGRPKGSSLWPERFDTDWLRKQRIVMGHDFEALYQGNPSAPEGQQFKRDWFRAITPTVLAHLKPKPLYRARSYDLAWSEKTSADYTVGLKGSLYKVTVPKEEIEDELVRTYLEMVEIPPVILVLEHVLRHQLEWDENSERIISTALGDGTDYTVLVEAVASQNLGFKSLKRDMRLWKHNVVPVTVERDKEVRAKNALRLGGKGAIFILYPNDTTPPEWEDDFLRELGTFPNGKNDDIVDTLTQFVNKIQPIIDRELNSYTNTGSWGTPMGTALDSGLLHKMPMFNDNSVGRFVKDKLGWV